MELLMKWMMKSHKMALKNAAYCIRRAIINFAGRFIAKPSLILLAVG